MRVLLDTHIALRAITDSSKLPETARELILDASNTIFLSAASVWEIAIKHRRKRSAMPLSGSEARHWFRLSGYRDLPITGQHAAAIDDLPPVHGDPFDRILIAQAITEPLRLLTHDETLAEYSQLILVV